MNILLIFLASAVITVPIFKRLGLGSVLGYLAAGAILGPWGLGVVSDVHSILGFSEFGVVLLLFVIGLELQPSRLWAMRRAVFGLGAGQLLGTGFLLAAVGMVLGFDFAPSLVAGLGLALSSTAFTLQTLAEKRELNTSYGRASFAILLFQDLAVIPLLAIVPALQSNDMGSTQWLPAFLKILGIVAILTVGGRYLLRPTLRLAASARSKEVFVAATLLVVVGAAWLMELAGFSMALGTFLAGVLLADSEYRHELEADIEPFKGLLLGLFFMAIGMSVDFGMVREKPGLLLVVTVGFMAAKYAVLYLLGRMAKFTDESAKNMAMALPQGGEFAFVLFGVAVQTGLFDKGLGDFLTVAVTFSMGLAPILIYFNEKLLCPRVNRENATYDQIPDEGNPVIIAGFGRFGQITGRILRAKGIGFTALEQDPEQVHLVRRFGNPIYYGDASRLDLLEMAGTAKAKVFVLAIDDVESSMQTARTVMKHFPHVKIYARARNRQHTFDLMRLGIEVIFRETFGSGLEMAEEVLIALGFPEDHAKRSVLKFRGHDERTLLDQYKLSGNEKELINYSQQSSKQLAELFRTDQKIESATE